MIKIYTLNNENVEEIKDGKFPLNNTVWIRCINPKKENINELVELTDIPINEFEDIIDEEEERPRLEINKRFTIIVLKSPYIEKDNQVTTVPLYIYIKKNVIITIESREINPIKKVQALIDKKRARFLFNKPSGFFLLYIIDKINDEFFTKIETISDTSEFLKKKVGGFNKRNIERIYSINTTLSYFNRALLANVEVIKSIRNNYFRFITLKNKDKLEDVYFDALTLIDTENVQRGIITGLFNIESVMNDYNLNQSMKRLTSIMLLLMIPTLITGVYGMNLANLPFAQHQHGFYIIIGIMSLIILISFSILWKADWI